ncbi:MAG: hypothetical protein CMF48_03685 [Legionellales bacterium]|nr:hypothetical protein [Legionellales bacterium]
MSVLQRSLLLLCIMVLIAIGLGTWRQQSQPMHTMPLLSATEIPSVKLPSFTLESTKGVEITPEKLKGGWSFMYFGYTSCPDICPATLAKLKVAAESLPENDNTRFIFVSADPMRDNLENLDAYVSAFSDRIEGGLGTHEQVATLAKALYVFLSNSQDPNQEKIDHSDTLLLINPRGELTAIYNAPASADVILSDFQHIKERSS